MELTTATVTMACTFQCYKSIDDYLRHLVTWLCRQLQCCMCQMLRKWPAMDAGQSRPTCQF